MTDLTEESLEELLLQLDEIKCPKWGVGLFTISHGGFGPPRISRTEKLRILTKNGRKVRR